MKLFLIYLICMVLTYVVRNFLFTIIALNDVIELRKKQKGEIPCTRNTVKWFFVAFGKFWIKPFKFPVTNLLMGIITTLCFPVLIVYIIISIIGEKPRKKLSEMIDESDLYSGTVLKVNHVRS